MFISGLFHSSLPSYPKENEYHVSTCQYPGALQVKLVIQMRCTIGMPTGSSGVYVCMRAHVCALESAESACWHPECECVCTQKRVC